ncbi:hypothetical protein ACPCSC_05820 [Streptomyces lavendulocolor]|uniref:hypothetical protein n=1 Tax=Streptomyces lavendulocolor TaxID=67316 RepID=UPI003C2C3868
MRALVDKALKDRDARRRKRVKRAVIAVFSLAAFALVGFGLWQVSEGSNQGAAYAGFAGVFVAAIGVVCAHRRRDCES